ncbi:MAG: hydrogenase maturation nickel metallochaperone HypA [Bacteroidia bacterium]|nr:hydrogenase maturation nickel metallochaperone HypA [Bacteroidia bacterium]
MHEISLVRNMFRALEETFGEAERSRIRAIRLKIGQLSNVEPLLMHNAFDAVVATDAPEYQQARLEIETVPIRIRCAACGGESAVEQYRFVCAHCGKPSSDLIAGTELLISGVELDE